MPPLIFLDQQHQRVEMRSIGCSFCGFVLEIGRTAVSAARYSSSLCNVRNSLSLIIFTAS